MADAIRMLANEEELSERNRDHALIGDYVDHRECHITPDWLLSVTESSFASLHSVLPE